ncbi:MAG: chemotaxis protein CheW [Roseicyclus sp.]|jgi:purine-binding chemotaxis protein CheW|nr:chemotaxis protein CheW [Roseicyclus sp.]
MTQTDTQTDPKAAAQTDAADIHGMADSGIDTMYLTFPVGEETYGVPIALVTEIVGMQRVMSVPDVPHYVRGVINLRGKVIPLMDVRLRFGMAERPYDDRTVVIVLEVGKAPIGLIVDGVSEVVDIPTDKLNRSAGYGADGQSVVSALGHVGERVAILLDVPVLVSDVDVAQPQLADA